VTLRAAIIALVGVLAAASIGALSLSRRPDDVGSKTAAWHGLFTDAQWSRVGARLERAGFLPGSARIEVASEQLALVSARRPSGSRCHIPMRGLTMGAPVCRLTKPITAFAAPGFFDEHAGGRIRRVPTIDVVAVVPERVTSVVVRHGAQQAGQPLLPTPDGFAFSGEFRGRSLTLVAYGANGKRLTADVIARGDR
jgi:hypothetical protein